MGFVSRGRGKHDLYVMDADGKNERVLVDNTKSGMKSGCFPPNWSPDSKKLVFAAWGRMGLPDPSANCDEAGGGALTDIYVINVDGSNLKQLTTPNNRPIFNFVSFPNNPAWSPVK